MSTGRRLAKRSIIGTRVSAPGPDGIWYSGVIEEVNTPTLPYKQSTASEDNNNCINLTPDTRYKVRFDFKTTPVPEPASDMDIEMDNSQTTGDVAAAVTVSVIPAAPIAPSTNALEIMIDPQSTLRRNAMKKEFLKTELIGPGFCTMLGIQLHSGQRVFITHNGRETSGDVLSHDLAKDEVNVRIATGNEEPIELKKRLEEVRLLESRRSPRLVNQDRDTDFARLADVGGDRRRTSHNIDVPLITQQNSRKRRPSFLQEEGDSMSECNAALVLMSLSHSPKSPSIVGQWNTMGSSPGSSSASWSSGTSSPPLSDDGQIILNDSTSRIRTTSLSTSDEGIAMDFSDETPRKRRAHCTRFKCTWKTCFVTENTKDEIERHIRNTHIGPKKPRQSPEEEFYYTEVEEDEDDDNESTVNNVKQATSPPSPTLSHRDMARPPHEDPEYQRHIGHFRQGTSQSHGKPQQCHNQQQQQQQNQTSHHNMNCSSNSIPTSPLAHHNYVWPALKSITTAAGTTITANNNHTQQTQQHNQHFSPVSPLKHARCSPRPSTSSTPYPSPSYVHHNHHHNNHHQYSHQHNLQQYQTQHVTITPSNPNHHNYHQTGQQMAHSAPASSITVTRMPTTIHQSPTNIHHNNILSPSPGSSTSSSSSLTMATINRSPQSPNRRTRGESKKCRKVYGMDRKDLWCTQCKWKKACSRFSD